MDPSEGQVLLDEMDLYRLTDEERSAFRNARFGVVPQGQTPIATLTVLENVLLPALLQLGNSEHANHRKIGWHNSNKESSKQKNSKEKTSKEKNSKEKNSNVKNSKEKNSKEKNSNGMNLHESSLVGKKPETELKERAIHLLEKLGIDKLQDAYPKELSGGECRRMSIARALILNPDVIFADEPTADLDDENTQKVLKLFREYADHGATVLLVTHDEEAFVYSDVVYDMKGGVLSTARYNGKLNEISNKENTQNEFLQNEFSA